MNKLNHQWKGRECVKSQDIYAEPEIFEFPNMVVRVHRPILTEEERARRMKAIEKATVSLLLSERRKTT